MPVLVLALVPVVLAVIAALVLSNRGADLTQPFADATASPSGTASPAFALPTPTSDVRRSPAAPITSVAPTASPRTGAAQTSPTPAAPTATARPATPAPGAGGTGAGAGGGTGAGTGAGSSGSGAGTGAGSAGAGAAATPRPGAAGAATGAEDGLARTGGGAMGAGLFWLGLAAGGVLLSRRGGRAY
ncbi:MAG TPA: hypothetical protein VNE62_09715 [Actinomycetota bacterium]|nr:hypothetical protein [Actinomycetota bacterium]